jgi:membrane-bound metal-dependent hydrolase YbcI (DUF457 family)
MKYSNMRYLIEYLSIAFLSYLILTGVVAFIGDVNYRELLCSVGQIYAILLCYIWIPIARMCDMEEHNSRIN